MSFLSQEEYNEKYKVTNKEAKSWWAKKNSTKYTDDFWKKLKKTNKLKFQKKIQRAKNSIRAATIADETGSTVTGSSTIDTWKILYGRNKVGGTVVFIDGDSNNTRIDMNIVLACHEINAITQMFIDGDRVIFPSGSDPTIGGQGDVRWAIDLYRGLDSNGQPIYASQTKGLENWAANNRWLIFLDQSSNGNPNQKVNASGKKEMHDRYGDYTHYPDTNTLSNRACAYVILVWNTLLFPNGVSLSDLEFEVEGAKLYDSRTGKTIFSRNPALMIADFLTNSVYGLGIPWDKIDNSALNEAANRCDDSITVTLSDGTSITEPRYTADIVFDISSSPESIIETLCTAMSGCVVYSEGLWKIHAGCFYAPDSLTYTPEAYRREIILTEDDILSNIDITTNVSRSDIFNHVRGTYISTTDYKYDETEFPVVKNDTYTDLDGGEVIWEDFSFETATSCTLAQRLARIEIEKVRSGLTCQFVATLKAFPLEPPDTLYVYNSVLGWTGNNGKGKLFCVESSQLVIEHDENQNPFFAVELVLKETNEHIYDATLSESTKDNSPNTYLPSAFITSAPSNLIAESGTDHLIVLNDGTVAARVFLTWDPSPNSFVTSGGSYKIEYKKHSSENWIIAGYVNGSANSYYILGVNGASVNQQGVLQGVAYDFRVIAVSSLGIESNPIELTNYTVIGKTEPPSNVTGLSFSQKDYGILLSWDEVPDLDLDSYIVKTGVDWERGTIIAQTKSNGFRWEIQEANTYNVMIKAIDTSGNESSIATSISIIIEAPSQVPSLETSFEEGNLKISWQPSRETKFAIKQYNIYYSTTEDGNKELVGSVKGTVYTYTVDYGGNRWWWVSAEDEKGNEGPYAEATGHVQAPSGVNNLTSDVIDNNALLKWNPPDSGTLPVDHYRLYKGENQLMELNEDLGSVFGTFATYFELISADYTYWIVAVDTAGNNGVPSSATVRINQPPDYSLKDDITFQANDITIRNNVIQNLNYLLLPCYDVDYEHHFTDVNNSSWQDQIDDGYIYYFQPCADSGYIEKTQIYYDETGLIETAIPQCIINLTWNQEDYVSNGSPCDVSCKISYYILSTNTWVDAIDGETQVLASGFSRIKFRITVTSPDTAKKAATKISDIRLFLTTKTITDQGEGIAYSSDSSGTLVTFNKDFYDVSSITVTPIYDSSINSTEPAWAIYDFVDTVNPEDGFRVFIYDKYGNRIDSKFAWIARGM